MAADCADDGVGEGDSVPLAHGGGREGERVARMVQCDFHWYLVHVRMLS